MKNTAENIISCRSAFALYKAEGIDPVIKYFPNQKEFVEQNKDKTIEEVTDLLAMELDSLETHNDFS